MTDGLLLQKSDRTFCRRKFRRRTFRCWTFRRCTFGFQDFSPLGHFATCSFPRRTFRRQVILPLGQFAAFHTFRTCSKQTSFRWQEFITNPIVNRSERQVLDSKKRNKLLLTIVVFRVSPLPVFQAKTNPSKNVYFIMNYQAKNESLLFTT